MNKRRAEGVLLTGVYGSGKSSVAEEIAYLLEQRGEPYALLDLDYLSWAGTGTGTRASEFGLLLHRLVDAGGTRVPARNPYWDHPGVTIADPDGYRLVLTGRSWP
jgi:MoxR-like ATPase